MSGFDAGWLALRESADHRARAAASAVALEPLAGTGRTLRVLDLGCGTGSNLRWLAPRLGGDQHWQCLDDDPGLLAALPRRLADWAAGAGMQVQRHGSRVRIPGRNGGEWLVSARRIDLANADLPRMLTGSDLVTASALADLVSLSWLEGLVRGCVSAGAALLLALDYDGRILLEPSHPHDAPLVEAFNLHQRGQKSFGPALGPEATGAARSLMESHGYTVRVMSSDWHLHARSDAELIRPLVEGWVGAAAEARPGAKDALNAWRDDRLRLLEQEQLAITVGHVDLLALPA